MGSSVQEEEFVRVVEDGNGVVVIEFFKEPVNALGIEDLQRLTEKLDSTANDDRTKVIVLCSRPGKGFNAGGDLKDIEEKTHHFEGILGQCLESMRLCEAIATAQVPVIAAIDRYCIGLGIEIAGSCDFCISTEETKFVFKEIDAGTVGGAGQILRLLPPQLARFLLYSGGTMTGKDMAKYGAILETCQDPLGRAVEIANVIATKNNRVLKAMKASLDMLEDFSPKKAMTLEQSYIFQLNMTGTAPKHRDQILRQLQPKRSKL